MKRILALSIVAFPLILQAQPETMGSAAYDYSTALTQRPAPGMNVGGYDTVVREGFVYSGIVVQMFNAPQPLQLINPLAPKEYGNGEQNLSLDPITKRPMGLKLFAISF
jgi:hypothetical protein